MLVVFEYDEETGVVEDRQGNVVATCMGLDESGYRTHIDDLVKLKQGGFSAEEIRIMKVSGVLP